jgi:hypothetical protein
MNYGRFGRKRSWLVRVTGPEFPWRNWGAPLKSPVRLAGICVEIRNEPLASTYIERYCYGSPFGLGGSWQVLGEDIEKIEIIIIIR